MSGILNAGAMEEGALPPRAHSVWAVATSAAFFRNWSVSKVLEAATWRSNPVFTSFYFRNISYSLDLSLVGTLCREGFGFTGSTFLVLFHVFITVSVVRVLLVTLWYVCHLPGIGLLLGLTYN